MKLFQITEEDLATLEADVPALADLLMSKMDNALRIKIRRLQKVIQNVRWNYGPPEQVVEIPADGPDTPEE